MKRKLRFALLGCGFWAKYQLPAWLELNDAVPVALYNRTLSKAQALGDQYGVPNCYDDAEALFKTEKLDFVDIITDVDTHFKFVDMAASYGLPVICQKPMAPSLETARRMLGTCSKHEVPFYIHENFRWQAPVRKMKVLLDSGVIGRPFKANVKFCTSFSAFDNQPFLAELDHFILTDVGSHVLDICRFLFGEVSTLYCQSAAISRHIKGEDVANVFLKMDSGLHCYAEMSFASILKNEAFPQTFILIEGEKGSLHLSKDYEITITTPGESSSIIVEPAFYSWADPAYAVAHSSIVDCNRNILEAMQGLSAAETTAIDNFETVKLVWAAYHSAEKNTVVDLKQFGHNPQPNNTYQKSKPSDSYSL